MRQGFPVFLLVLAFVFSGITGEASAASGWHFKTHRERKALRKARNYDLRGQHLKAREQYQALVDMDSTNFQYNYELGMNYYFAYDNGSNTIRYLQAALRHSPKDTVGELFFYLADACHNANRFAEATYYFHRFESYIMDGSASDNLRNEISNQIRQCELALAWLQPRPKNTGFSPVENAGPGINTASAEYAPVVNEADSLMMYTSRNPDVTGSRIDHWDEKYFEDMYVAVKSGARFGAPEKFSATNMYTSLIPNSRRHDAVVSLSLDEKQLITFRDNKLWISTLQDGKWTGPEIMPKNINVGRYQPHASLSYDGKTIYFTSDRSGGYGGLDIYKCVKKDNGDWSEPVNMGPEINTPKDEDSPQVSYDSRTLYFSSKGHNSIGGYDIFRSTFNPETGKWSDAENMGIPLNSGGDDIFYRPNRAGTLAYFSSYRPEGYGDMDIYIYHLPKKAVFENCLTMADLQRMHWPITFQVVSGDSFLVNEGAVFEARDFTSGSFDLLSSNWKIDTSTVYDSSLVHYAFGKTGKHEVKLSLIGLNKVTQETAEFCVSKEVKVYDKETPLVINGTLNRDSLEHLNQTHLPELGLQQVYYGFDQWELGPDAQQVMDKNIGILKQHPEVIIKVSGNTDSRGSSAYNRYLSEKRARYVVNYLEQHGIPKSRIVAVISNGEDHLVNKCGDTENCPNSEHALNRRTEISVVATK
jgi:outer membrane protein OmpA-like peptidoglycan-associated protein